MYKKCVNCNLPFPEYVLDEYKRLHLSPICPICAKELIQKIFKKIPSDPFETEDFQDIYNEALDFRDRQRKGNWGGHMINPPDSCPYRKRVGDGGEWVDLGNCQATCKDRCSRFFNFCRMTPDERADELYDNGVVSV